MSDYNVIQIRTSNTNDTPANGILSSGELAYSFTSNDLFIGSVSGNVPILVARSNDTAKLNFGETIANVQATDVTISNTLTVNGDILLRGSALTIGDGNDIISLGATVNTNIIPTTNTTLNLGSDTNYYSNLFVSSVYLTGDPTENLQAATKQYVDTTLSTAVSSISSIANSIPLGIPDEDGIYSNGKSTTAEGAVTSLTSSTNVSDAVDKLNEVMLNVYNNTYVRDVSFTISNTAGGAPLDTELTITTTGNPNRFDISWGDGTFSNNTSDSTPNHTYTNTSGGSYNISVVAFNNNALGEGNNATTTVNNAIVVFTPDPSAAFTIHDALTNGNTIIEANTGDQIFLDNNTTNANGVVATFHINWGDGTSDSISNTSVEGGTEGSRIDHIYTSDTGFSTNTITLSINTHSTANPASLPDSITSVIKIFDTSIAPPQGLANKTFTLSSSSVGSSPRVASGFIDNSSGTTLNVGDTPIRYTTSGNIQTSGSVTTQFTHDADNGTLTALIDNSADGSITFDSNDNSGTYDSLVIIDESDFNQFSNTGTSVSNIQKIYASGLYSGFKTRISKNNLSIGAHTYKLFHSTTGNTNQLDFIKDNLTSTPSIDFSTTTVTENTAGTLAYVSGIPYYTNNAKINVIGTKITNLTGQTYRNTTTPFTFGSGQIFEGESGSIINSQSKTYTILPSSQLNSNYPIANTGMSSPITLDTFQLNINGGGKRVQGFNMNVKNVNGTSTSVNFSNTKISVMNGSSSGINELAIPVSDSLGATFDDDAVRITGFTGVNPTFSSSTNYYTGSTWSGAQTIIGTDEAVIRYGSLQHFASDLSTGFLPAGPNLSSGRSGTQKIIIAFRRTQVANFNVTLSGRVSSFHIAAPGTGIDSASTLNGWLDAGDTYAGSGIPGGNTGSGGNGSDGCAFTSGDTILANTTYNNRSFQLTLGSENGTNAFGNQILISIGLSSGQSISALSIS